MNKKDLIDILAERNDFYKKDIAVIVDDLFEVIVEGVKSKGKVSIHGFGSFVNTERSSREYRNPKTGESVQAPAKNVIRFKAAKALKDALN